MRIRLFAGLGFAVGISFFALSAQSQAEQKSAEEQKLVSDGKSLFVAQAIPACAVCHRLKHASAVGEIGPSLDELMPDAMRVEAAVKNGIGLMPAYTGLSAAQIKLLAEYVARVAGK